MCLNDSGFVILEPSSKQGLNRESDMKGSVPVVEMVRRYVKALDGLHVEEDYFECNCRNVVYPNISQPYLPLKVEQDSRNIAL